MRFVFAIMSAGTPSTESVGVAPPIKAPATPGGLGELVVTHSPQKQQLVCARCGETCDISALGASGSRGEVPKNPVELICANTYKSIAKSWRKNAKLKAWFQSLGESERKAWYCKHKRLAERQPNLKRDFETEITTSTEIATGDEKRRRFHWKPWGQFEKEEQMKKTGISDQEVQQKWRLALLGAPSVQKFGNEWHIKEYLGVYEDEVDSCMTKQTTSQRAAVANEQSLREALKEQELAMAAIRASREKDPGDLDESAPEVPEDFINNIEKASARATAIGDTALEGLVARYNMAEQVKHELAAVYMEESAEAEPFAAEAPAEQHNSEIWKLTTEREALTTEKRAPLAVDEVMMEHEQLIAHIEGKASVEDDEGELASAVDESKELVKELVGKHGELKKVLKDHLGNMLAAIKADPPSPTDETKAEMMQEVELFLGSSGPLGKLKKCIHQMTNLLAKRGSPLANAVGGASGLQSLGVSQCSKIWGLGFGAQPRPLMSDSAQFVSWGAWLIVARHASARMATLRHVGIRVS